MKKCYEASCACLIGLFLMTVCSFFAMNVKHQRKINCIKNKNHKKIKENEIRIKISKEELKKVQNKYKYQIHKNKNIYNRYIITEQDLHKQKQIKSDIQDIINKMND